MLTVQLIYGEFCRFVTTVYSIIYDNKKLIDGDEIANVNILYDEIVHALENAMDSCINSTTGRFLQRRFTKFSEITQCNGHHAVQGHSNCYQSKAHIRLPISDQLPPILHRFQVMADYWSNFC